MLYEQSKDLIIEEDPMDYYSSQNKTKGINLNINKYMINTFNKSKLIARNASGIVQIYKFLKYFITNKRLIYQLNMYRIS